jgi:hypothetical protein
MQDFNATIAQATDIDLKHIDHSPLGRHFTVTDKGVPLTVVFA